MGSFWQERRRVRAGVRIRSSSCATADEMIEQLSLKISSL